MIFQLLDCFYFPLLTFLHRPTLLIQASLVVLVYLPPDGGSNIQNPLTLTLKQLSLLTASWSRSKRKPT
jgi:hypothetical protein